MRPLTCDSAPLTPEVPRETVPMLMKTLGLTVVAFTMLRFDEVASFDIPARSACVLPTPIPVLVEVTVALVDEAVVEVVVVVPVVPPVPVPELVVAVPASTARR